MATSRKAQDQSTDDNSGKELVPQTFSREELGAIQSFEDAVRLAAATFGTVTQAHEEPLLGDGFRVATEDDKMRLIGVPLFLLDWAFRISDYGQEDWVSVHAIQPGSNNEAIKWIINDGGTGIARDLREYTVKTGRMGGLQVRNGLRVSKYFIDSDTKEALTKQQVREYQISGKGMSPAATFYLDTSA